MGSFRKVVIQYTAPERARKHSLLETYNHQFSRASGSSGKLMDWLTQCIGKVHITTKSVQSTNQIYQIVEIPGQTIVEYRCPVCTAQRPIGRLSFFHSYLTPSNQIAHFREVPYGDRTHQYSHKGYDTDCVPHGVGCYFLELPHCSVSCSSVRCS